MVASVAAQTSERTRVRFDGRDGRWSVCIVEIDSSEEGRTGSRHRRACLDPDLQRVDLVLIEQSKIVAGRLEEVTVGASRKLIASMDYGANSR